jgi:hypothetical protein
MVAAPQPSDLLAAWEEGEGRTPLDRALALLALAEPGADRTGLAALTVAERDERLLDLRTSLWGPRLEAFVRCPECGERLEFAIDAGALGRAPGDAGWTVEAGGVEARFRLPDTSDLAAAAACAGPGEGRRVLVERCIEAPTPRELPEEAVAAVAARMAEVAGPADVTVGLSCPACRHEWPERLDVAAFVWRELSAAVRRLMVEVAALAGAYGWSEEEVLALPASRRHRYLELAG